MERYLLFTVLGTSLGLLSSETELSVRYYRTTDNLFIVREDLEKLPAMRDLYAVADRDHFKLSTAQDSLFAELKEASEGANFQGCFLRGSFCAPRIYTPSKKILLSCLTLGSALGVFLLLRPRGLLLRSLAALGSLTVTSYSSMRFGYHYSPEVCALLAKKAVARVNSFSLFNGTSLAELRACYQAGALFQKNDWFSLRLPPLQLQRVQSLSSQDLPAEQLHSVDLNSPSS